MMLERPEHSDSGRDAVIRYELNNDFEGLDDERKRNPGVGRRMAIRRSSRCFKA